MRAILPAGIKPSRRAGRRTCESLQRQAPAARRGMLLVVVLVVISVLALLGASFSYWMHADLAAVDGLKSRQQARLAAESGLARVMLLLRDQRTDMDHWYNNREAFRRILVWAPERIGGSESLADQEAIEGQPAWRFSVVATEYEGERPRMRYGVMDEAGKLNLNVATREQLLALFGPLKLRDVTPEQLTDALMDWVDKDDDVTPPSGAESSYYMTLDPPYKAKNKPLDTVEELLMVRYFNGRILYGEDYNRNGYLDTNEDDGLEGVFPPDDGDGLLDRGLLPYVTVYSWDANSANDNKPRININAYRFANADKLPELVQETLGADVIEFLAEAQKRGYTFRSVGELLGLQVYEDGSSNYDEAWAEYDKARQKANAVGPSEETQPAEDEGASEAEGESRETDRRGSEMQGEGQESEAKGDSKTDDQDGPSDREGQGEAGEDEESPRDEGKTDNFEEDESEEDDQAPRAKDRSRRLAPLRSRTPVKAQDEEETADPQGAGTEDPAGRRDGRRAGRGGRRGSEDQPASEDQPDQGEADGRRGGRDRGDGAAGERPRGRRFEGPAESEPGAEERTRDRPGRRRGPSDTQPDGEGKEGTEGQQATGQQGTQGGGKKKSRGTPVASPVSVEQMAMFMDRLTVQAQPVLRGLINVNTAPVAVLKTIPGLTEEEVQAIASRRGQLGGEDKMTPAWMVSTGVVDPVKFALISNGVTARSIQFTVDVIGFADHVGAIQRIQAVVEMQGQLSQVKYYRDITGLGVGYPLTGDQRSEGFELDVDR